MPNESTEEIFKRFAMVATHLTYLRKTHICRQNVQMAVQVGQQQISDQEVTTGKLFHIHLCRLARTPTLLLQLEAAAQIRRADIVLGAN